MGSSNFWQYIGHNETSENGFGLFTKAHFTWLLVLAVLYDYRRKHLLSSWSKDIDLVEVKIEVYGLGRFYGLSGDKNNLSVPMDILELIADRYDIGTKGLYAVYTKGLYNGLYERENKLSDYS